MYVLTALVLSLKALRGIETELAAGQEKACELGFHLEAHLPRSKVSTAISSPLGLKNAILERRKTLTSKRFPLGRNTSSQNIYVTTHLGAEGKPLFSQEIQNGVSDKTSSPQRN